MTNIKFTNVCIHKTCEVSAGLLLIVAMVEACSSVSQLLRLFFHSCRGGFLSNVARLARCMMNENHKEGWWSGKLTMVVREYSTLGLRFPWSSLPLPWSAPVVNQAPCWEELVPAVPEAWRQGLKGRGPQEPSSGWLQELQTRPQVDQRHVILPTGVMRVRGWVRRAAPPHPHPKWEVPHAQKMTSSSPLGTTIWARPGPAQRPRTAWPG